MAALRQASPVELSPRLTRTELGRLLDRYQLSPSRALGQNFLAEPSLADKIVRLAGVSSTSRVVEIGPGLGSLTVALADVAAEVVAVEVDRYLLDALGDVLVQFDLVDKVRIVHGDATTIDWDATVGDGPWQVVANLPYNVSTPLILDLLADEPRFDRFLVMVQKEAGDRLAAEPGSRRYGIPSVLLGYWADARVVASVPAEVFLPRPKVASVLVEIVRRPGPPPEVPFDRVATAVRTGFGQRRKMLRRSLAPLVAPDDLQAAGIDPTRRAETLSLTEWLTVANLIQ